MGVLCVLPARLGSERIPNKPLRSIAGRPLIEWSWRTARAVSAFDAVWVATDSREIAACVRAFGGEAVLTSERHRSGTDRVAEVLESPEARGFETVVNFQADELFVDAGAVERAVEAVRSGRAPIATLAAPIRSEAEWRTEAVVKVARAEDGRALYFSRAPIPHLRGATPAFGGDGDSEDDGEAAYLRHVGIYVTSRDALRRWTSLDPSPLERIERLEQLRALEDGLAIHVVVGAPTEPGIDEPDDLVRAERILRTRVENEAGSPRDV